MTITLSCREEVESVVKSLKTGNLAQRYHIPSEVVQAGEQGHDRYINHHLQQDTVDRKVIITLDSIPDHHFVEERQPKTKLKLPCYKYKPGQSSKLGHANNPPE